MSEVNFFGKRKAIQKFRELDELDIVIMEHVEQSQCALILWFHHNFEPDLVIGAPFDSLEELLLIHILSILKPAILLVGVSMLGFEKVLFSFP